MKGIARFFTLYWMIYFPTCIAYNDLPGFSSIDEVMTGVLMIYTLLHMGQKYINAQPWKEFFIFWGVLAFYTVYSLTYGVNVKEAVWLDFIQELRPYTVLFCTWILNPQFTKKQKKWMLFTMIATLVSWIYYHPETVDPTFEAEFPVLGQLAICTGMSYYLFTQETTTNRIIAILLVLSGMLAPKFKFMGEVVCFVALIYFMKKRLNFRSVKTLISVLTLLVAVLYITWERFDKYYVTGFNSTILARPLTYRTAFGQIIWDYIPFGPGMGTFACNGAWRYYSPLYEQYGLNHVWGLDPGGGFICDAYYPTLAQFGIVGIFLFIWFWKRRIVQLNSIQNMKYYRVAWMTLLCLIIEQTADSSMLSGKDMGYLMLLGLCMNQITVTKKKKKTVKWDPLGKHG